MAMLFIWFGTGVHGGLHIAWTTVTCFGLPVAKGDVTVMVATLVLLPGLFVQVAVMVPLPDPEAGDMVHHVWVLEAVHGH